eukprot:TRINITY_DN57594_c0_g1_i1.p1 TRINITY_DN57594_c0_g1~~TRINITY_DN57594_c0_g1_i1.p1  ORF type:complete len:200 (-),score=27.80 TRINITY_DN57594_c0_g1_i1:127-726(-)
MIVRIIRFIVTATMPSILVAARREHSMMRDASAVARGEVSVLRCDLVCKKSESRRGGCTRTLSRLNDDERLELSRLMMGDSTVMDTFCMDLCVPTDSIGSSSACAEHAEFQGVATAELSIAEEQGDSRVDKWLLKNGVDPNMAQEAAVQAEQAIRSCAVLPQGIPAQEVCCLKHCFSDPVAKFGSLVKASCIRGCANAR